MAAHLEIAGTSIILAGEFTPSLFQPSWFERHELLGEEHARSAEEKLRVFENELVTFEAEWVEVQVTQENCSFVTTDSAKHADLRDLVASTFSLLPENPLRAVGLNRNVHYRLDDEDEYQAIGNRFAPKDAWTFMDDPRLRTVTMQSVKTEGREGTLFVELAPSVKVPRGVYIGINDHFVWTDAEGEPRPAEEVPTLLEEEWEASRVRANAIVSAILGL